MQSIRRQSRAGRLAALLLGSALTVFGGGIWLAGCRGGGARMGESDRLTVWVSGDTRGYIEPCGCRRDQEGGLPARMTLVTQEKSPYRLLVDVGNITSGGRSYELLKLDYILRGMAAMGYDAVNLGRNEVNLDRDTLLQKIQSSQLPFVSCNVLDAQTGKPLAAPTLVKTVGGMRIGLTGVVQMEGSDIGPGLRVRPPDEALAAILPELKKQSDFVMVLAFAPSETLQNLATRFPEIRAIFGGNVPQSSEKAETVNRAVLFNVTDKGKVVGRLDFKPVSESGLTLTNSRSYKTMDSIAPAPAMTALIREFKDTLRERNIEFAAASEGFDPIQMQTASADAYAGEAKCQGCHPTSHKVNHTAAHTHAYETLVHKNSEYDPECLRCHTVGYGAKDGFVNRQKTPQLAGVQCENCHGRGQAHIAAVLAGERGTKANATLRAVTPNSCVRCHDEENSANFTFAAYWPKIKHAREPKHAATLR